MRILVIDDDPALLTSISDLLSSKGHRVESAEHSESALRAIAERKFDAIVLGGVDIYPEIRRSGVQTPIIKRGDKPLPPAEILARLEAISPETFEYEDVTIDFRRAQVRRNGSSVNLAGKELQLLRYLIDNRERIVPREEIMRKVWEYASDTASRTIDTHVAWLRQKLQDNTQPPRHIQTIRGKGYRFTAR